MKFILALDQGTTSSRAVLFDERGALRAVAQKEFRQIFPRPGWVEHDPNEIWASELAVATEALALASAHASDVAAIEDDEAGAGGALIDRANIIRHGG